MYNFMDSNAGFQMLEVRDNRLYTKDKDKPLRLHENFMERTSPNRFVTNLLKGKPDQIHRLP